MKKLIFLVMVLISVSAYAESVDLIGVPEAFQGIWTIDYISKDKGKTSQKSLGDPVYRVFATQLQVITGQVWNFKRIWTDKDEKNIPYLFISFVERDVIWIISVVDSQTVLVQVFNSDSQETMRVLSRILK